MAGIVSGKIDDFVLNLVDGDLDAGTAQGLSKELSEARSLWQRMRGSERVGAAMEAAKDAASGYENGLRIEFRKLIKDVKFFRSLSKPEQAAIRQVVQGTTVGNILKRASSAPSRCATRVAAMGERVALGTMPCARKPSSPPRMGPGIATVGRRAVASPRAKASNQVAHTSGVSSSASGGTVTRGYDARAIASAAQVAMARSSPIGVSRT